MGNKKEEKRNQEDLLESLQRKVSSLELELAQYRGVENQPAAVEAQYRTLLDNIPDILYSLDDQGRVLTISTPTSEFYGYSLAEIQGRPFTEFIHPLDQERVVSSFLMALETRREWTRGLEFRMLAKDGAVRWMELNSHARFNNRGEFIQEEGVLRDVTDRKQAEEATLAYVYFLESLERVNRLIRESDDLELLLKKLLDEIMAIFDSDRAWLLYPCDPESPTWRIPMECNKPEYPGAKDLNKDLPMVQSVKEDIESALASEGPVVQVIGTRHPVTNFTAEQFKVQAQMFMAIYPRISKPWLLGIHQCSFARAWSENEQHLFNEIGRRVSDALSNLLSSHDLRVSEEKYRLVVENAEEAIFVVQEGKLRFANDKTQGMLGITNEGLTSRPLIEFVHPEDRGWAHELYIQIIDGEDIPPVHEFRMVRKSGEVRYVEIKVVKIEWEGKPATLNFLSDITERKQAEEELRLNEGRLEALLKLSLFTKAPLKELTDFALEEGIRLTSSNIGYLAFMNDDETVLTMYSWSKAALAQCEITEKPIIYPVEKTGLWGEAVRQRRPIITNDYAASKFKKGYPEGHVRVKRHMNVPIFDGDKIVAVAGVGNKQEEYDDSDVRQLTLLIQGMWSIVKRQRAEEDLRASEERFRETVELLPTIVCEYDLNGRFTYVNKYGLEVFGYTPEDLEQGLYAFQMFPEDEIVRFEDRFGSLFKGLKQQSTEYRARRKDGSIIEVIANSSPIYKHGNVVGARSSITPITELKKIEKALRESEQKYKELSNSLPQVVFETDELGVITFTNRIAFDLFGYTQDDFNKGVNAFQMIIPEETEKASENMLRVLSGEHLGSVEYTALRKDGSVFPIIIHANRIMDNDKAVGLRGIIIDISDRKKSEDALRDSEEKFRHIAETVEEIIIQFDLTGKLSYCSPSLEKILGFSPEEVQNKNLMDYLPSSEHEKAEAYLMRLSSGDKAELLELQILNKDGIPVVFEVNATPIIKDREIIGFQGVSRDTTERRQAEAERIRLEDQLHQAQKMQAIGTLAGGIAHDFNNLLQVISGFTEMLVMTKKGGDPELSHLSAIQKAADRASQLIRQLLIFSRKIESEHKPVDLNKEIVHSIELLKRVIPKMVEIKFSPESKLSKINADSIQLEQVLLNLGGNAADAMPDGGALLIKTENAVLDDDSCQPYIEAEPGNYVILSVTDTGQGMDNETTEHIFEPFYTTKEIGKGTGLGLASVYGIVKSHGGFITCSSELGKGTTFSIYLPAIDETPAQMKEDHITETPKGGTETILIVDDEEPIRDIAYNAFKDLGYQVLTASTGEQALEIYSKRSNTIDMIVLDIGMPGMGGYNCLREITRINPKAKVLIATGYSTDGLEEKTMEAGAAGYATKPYRLHELLGKVRQILDEKI